MIFAGDNNNAVRKNPVHQPVFLGNAPGPVPRQISFQRFRFPLAVERIPQYRSDKGIDFGKNFFVVRGPLEICVKSGFFKANEEPRSKLQGIFVGEEIYYTGRPYPAFQSNLARCHGAFRRLYGVVQGFKGYQVFPLFDIGNGPQKPFAVGGGTKQEFRFIRRLGRKRKRYRPGRHFPGHFNCQPPARGYLHSLRNGHKESIT